MIKRLIFVLLLAVVPVLAQGPAYPYSVGLTCTPPITGTVTGYNFYRAPFSSSCGTFAKINANPTATCAYTDANPPQGVYCYEATSLDGTAESGPDLMPGQVSIPPPPPTNLGAVVAKNTNGSRDVIYLWTNPVTALNGNSLYCNGKRAVEVFFPTSKVRVTTPAGNYGCVVTALGPTGESGSSNQVKFSVP